MSGLQEKKERTDFYLKTSAGSIGESGSLQAEILDLKEESEGLKSLDTCASLHVCSNRNTNAHEHDTLLSDLEVCNKLDDLHEVNLKLAERSSLLDNQKQNIQSNLDSNLKIDFSSCVELFGDKDDKILEESTNVCSYVQLLDVSDGNIFEESTRTDQAIYDRYTCIYEDYSGPVECGQSISHIFLEPHVFHMSDSVQMMSLETTMSLPTLPDEKNLAENSNTCIFIDLESDFYSCQLSSKSFLGETKPKPSVLFSLGTQHHSSKKLKCIDLSKNVHRKKKYFRHDYLSLKKVKLKLSSQSKDHCERLEEYFISSTNILERKRLFLDGFFDIDFKIITCYPVFQNFSEALNVLSSNGQVQEDLPSFMFVEWLRLFSFWALGEPLSVSFLELANNGFYYEKETDRIVCVSCQCVFPQGTLQGSVRQVHRVLSPNCPFIDLQDRLNLPVSVGTNLTESTSQEASSFSRSSRFLQTGDHLVAAVGESPASGSATIGETALPLQKYLSSANVESQAISSANESVSDQRHLDSGVGQTEAPTRDEHTPTEASDTRREEEEAESASENAQVLQEEVERQRTNDRTSQGTHADSRTSRSSIGTHGGSASGAAGTASSAPRTKYSFTSINVQKPRYAENAILANRVRSFQDSWPDIGLPAEIMARCGYFHMDGNFVRCFFCGGGLRNLKPGDDPWYLHAKYFPKCMFLIQNKGMDYVQGIQGNRAERRERGETATGAELTTDEDIISSSAAQSVEQLGYTVQTVVDVVKTWLAQNQGKHLEDLTSETLMKWLFKLKDGEEDDITSSYQDTFEAMAVSLTADLDRLSGEDRTITEHVIEKLRLICIACHEQQRCTAFLPCGDILCCKDCALVIQRCPKCKKTVNGTIRIYFS